MRRAEDPVVACSFPIELLLKTIREAALAPRNWQLDAKGLTVVFQRGSVGSGSV